MAYRNIYISNSSKIQVRNNQLIITEKQYESIEILVGQLKEQDTSEMYEQMTIF